MRIAIPLLSILLCLLPMLPAEAQKAKSVKPPAKGQKSVVKPVATPAPIVPPKPERIVGFPQDAGPHDAGASIEWWYFNSFLKTETGRNISVVGSFFRTGLSSNKKGHYLIYSLTDLDAKTHQSFSILDKTEMALLYAALPLIANQRPDDPRPFRLMRQLQNGELPAPHQKLGTDAVVQKGKLFSIAFDNNTLSQLTEDGRTWKAQLSGPDWNLELTLSQPERTPMLVGGKGLTGIRRPEDFYYLSLTRMKATGTLTSEDGVVEKLTGDGWLDRQWGSPEFVASYGWDWLGLQLDSGDDLILHRIRDVVTGKVVRYEATMVDKEGKLLTDPAGTLRPTGAVWRDPESGIAFPAKFEVNLPGFGYKFNITPAFPDQTIPVIGIGDAIWEGIVTVEGTNKEGGLLTGRGYMELVGYKR